MTTLVPLTERQETLIVNNVIKAVKDIENLNKTGYNFLYLCSGFIAHYNLGGFKAFYSDESLKKDIIEFLSMNQWLNFRPNDKDYEYYQSKARVYNRIVAELYNLR